MEALQRVIEVLRPSHVVYPKGAYKVRVGPPRDGGYVLFDYLCQDADLLVSFGIGDDVSFELDFLRRYPAETALLFDPNIEKPPVEHPKFHFSRAPALDGVGRMTPDAAVKMDIEWDEWHLLEHVSFRCAQLVMEAHLLPCVPPSDCSPYFRGLYDRLNTVLFQRYADALQRLASDYHLCHAHTNNSLPPQWVLGRWLPPLWELTWVRKDLVEVQEACFDDFPVRDIDHPNKNDRPDYSFAYLEEDDD
jgi:hypothetical protein